MLAIKACVCVNNVTPRLRVSWNTLIKRIRHLILLLNLQEHPVDKIQTRASSSMNSYGVEQVWICYQLLGKDWAHMLLTDTKISWVVDRYCQFLHVDQETTPRKTCNVFIQQVIAEYNLILILDWFGSVTFCIWWSWSKFVSVLSWDIENRYLGCPVKISEMNRVAWWHTLPFFIISRNSLAFFNDVDMYK